MARAKCSCVAIIIVVGAMESGARAENVPPPKYTVLLWNEGAGLLGHWQVRDELKLTADQVAKIQVIGDELTEKMRSVMRDSKMSPEERRKQLAEIRRQREQFSADGILDARQAARFRQMQLWHMGIRVFLDAKVAAMLKLTEEQREALRGIVNEQMNKLAEISRENPNFGRSGGGIPDEVVAKNKAILDGLRSATEKACREVLTESQRDEFDMMRGPKFEIDMSMLRK